MALPSFSGKPALLTMIRTLIMRDEERALGPLPIVCLIREDAAGVRLTSALQAELHEAQPDAVPCARVVASEPRPKAAEPEEGVASPAGGDPGAVLPLLHALSEQLAERFGGNRLRFPHYRLADWLTRQVIAEDSADRRAELLRRMVERLGPGATVSLVSAAADNAPSAPIRLILLFFARFWPIARTWLWLSGAVPGWGRQIRWFMRQTYMSPRPAGDFLGFALRLTVERSQDGELRPRGTEELRQVRLLLVHAFLQDLRAGYRRRPWRISAWRRTGNPVALVDGLRAGDRGEKLLSLISDVRNETGQDDPLLVIAEFDDRDSVWAGAPRRPAVAAEADGAWLDELVSRRHHMEPDAWRLAFTIALGGAPEGPADGHADFTPPKPPLAARPHVLASATIAVVLAAGGCLAWVGMPYVRAKCALFDHGGVAVMLIDGECVGYSDADSQLFDNPESSSGAAVRLRLAERAVFRQNACAAEALANDPEQQRLTVVYLAGFSADRDEEAWSSAQAEELEGLLLRQIEQNGKAETDGRCGHGGGPYLRIVIANGGSRMRYADRVVEDQLGHLIRDDPYVIGVVGLDRTVIETERAISELGNLGVPVLTTTLSGEGIVHDSPLYFQMVPSNSIQARLVADYASKVPYKGRRVSRVHIFYPKIGASAGMSNDLYVTSLVNALKDSLSSVGVRREVYEYSVDHGSLKFGKKPPTACSGRPGDMIFYAGRHEDFAGFLKAVFTGCNRPSRTTPIVADDAISRFPADVSAHDTNVPAQVDIDFVTKGSSVVLAGQACPGRGSTASGQTGNTTLATFCRRLHVLYEREQNEDTTRTFKIGNVRWAGERVGLAYDAASMLLMAAQAPYDRRDLGIPYEPSRAAVAQQLRDQRYGGVIGDYRFAASRVQDGMNIAIVRVVDVLASGKPPVCQYMAAYNREKARVPCPR
ncbi:MAG: Uncharacterized protein JWQ95_1593 [Sphaerisporangium sp.]|nr:Uncharacterized protein [Sphaerisporangium sp.]